MGSEEHRRSKRVIYYAEASIEDLGGGQARISDLSTSGAFVDTRSTFPPGTVMKVTFRVRDREIQVTVVVRYAIPDIGMGVHFMNLSPEDQAIIEEVIKAQG